MYFYPLITIKHFFKSFVFIKTTFTLKTKIVRYFPIVGVLGLIVAACSTTKDTFVNRSFHSITTEYNILYNGDLALEAGIQELEMLPDNYWEILPVEKMQILEPVFGQDSIPRNANFRRAEDKAVKAIENHSMSVGGLERNPQMDEAYLLLGKARYYDQRFIPALEAFNFIMYKYPDSDRINEIKIWREKTNIRLESNILAIQGLKKVLSEVDFKDREIVAEANATLAIAFYNEEQNDSAINYLRKATDYTQINENKARYTFILGQLLEKQDRKEEAVAAFQKVIDMNRKSPREYVIQSHAKIASIQQNEPDFIEKFDKLLKDRENRPYLDVLNHQVALHFDKLEQDKEAAQYYNQSLKNKSKDAYRVASNYRNLAEINFYNAQYSLAGKYYDSTLVSLDNRTREFRNIKRKRENLEDVIKYESIAVANDSVLSLVRMSAAEREDFFKQYIDALQKEEKRRQELEDIMSRQQSGRGTAAVGTPRGGDLSRQAAIRDAGSAQIRDLRAAPGAPPGTSSSQSSGFYFYNQTSVATGKSEFRKRWGNRTLKDYWRLINYTGSTSIITDEPDFDEDGNEIVRDRTYVEPRFTTEFYTSQIPDQQVVIDSLQKERNFAYYQLGIIYKDKFKEYELAQSKLEDLLKSNPEERLVLPAMYNLYKIYEVLGSPEMASMKSKITAQYPDSRYAYVINNPNSDMAMEGSPDLAYRAMFRIYESGDFRLLMQEIEPLIDQYSGEEIISKLELLKANAIGNLKGLEQYKKALNYVALTYPNSAEGKEAESILNTNIPKLEKLDFGQDSFSWKLLYKIQHGEDIAELTQKLDKFMADRPNDKLKITLDSYTQNEDFVVIHNVNSEQRAKDLITILEEYKDYKIKEKFVFISSEDYKVVQINKNYNTYLQKLNPTP